MSGSKPAQFDDDDYPVEPRQKKGPSLVVWGLLALCCLAVVAVAFIYEARRTTQMQLIEAEQARADTEAANRLNILLIEANQARAEAKAGWQHNIRGQEHGPVLVEPSEAFLRASLPERFKVCRLDPIVRDAKWYFSLKDDQFVLECGGDKLPAELQKAFLEPDEKASRIEGKWQLVDGNNKMVFSNILVDGKQRAGDVSFRIEPAGLIRVNIGSHQYNVMPERTK
jgi:hypothetical protein